MENHQSETVKIFRLAILDGMCLLIFVLAGNLYISIVMLPVMIILSLIIFFRCRNFLKESITEE